MTVRISRMGVALAALVFVLLQLGLYKLYGSIRTQRAWEAPYQTVAVRQSRPDTKDLPRLTLGFIGDSNTVRGNPSPPETTARLLSKAGRLRDVTVINAGRGGMSAEDWRPDSPTGIFKRATGTFRRAHVQVVCVMLGTNSGGPEARQGRFEQNMTAIVKALKGDGFLVVLNYFPYNFQPAATSPLGQAKSAEYLRVIDRICRSGSASSGDQLAFDYFRRHPEETTQGIHLTQAGSDSLGFLWTVRLQEILKSHKNVSGNCRLQATEE